MVVGVGEKVHVLVRRRFESDVRRQLVGAVVAADGVLIRVRAFSFSFEPAFNLYTRSETVRDQVVALDDAHNLVTVLPAEADLDRLEFRMEGNRTVLTDGSFVLQVEEIQARR